MATSEYQGRLQTGAGIAAPDELGSSVVRDLIVNNANHYADEYAQVRATVAARSGAKTGYIGTRSAGLLADAWYQIAQFGPFPIAVKQGGGAYHMRVRIAGASDDGGAVDFYAFLAPPQQGDSIARRIRQGLNVDYIYKAPCASATPAWLTGQSMGTIGYSTQIALTVDEASDLLSETRTLTDVSGDPTVVQQHLVSLYVYGYTGAGSQPRLHGFYAAEWVG